MAFFAGAYTVAGIFATAIFGGIAALIATIFTRG